MLRLGAIFFIDVAALAVVSNYYHVVLHINKAESDRASGMSIVQRWHRLFSGTEASQKYAKGESLDSHERLQVDTH